MHPCLGVGALARVSACDIQDPVGKRTTGFCFSVNLRPWPHLRAGGTASGKTTVCDQIMQRLHDQCVVMLSQDSFYRNLTQEEQANVESGCLTICAIFAYEKNEPYTCEPLQTCSGA